jgi:hypothetical protein
VAALTETLIAAALIVAGIGALVVWATRRIVAALARTGEGQSRRQMLEIAAMFAPAMASRAADPRVLLAWQPLAAALRKVYPDEFAALDAAAGRTFPFSAEDIQAAHGKWTADWLAWERLHDGEFKLKAAAAAAELPQGGAVARARVDAVECEKLELYQRRYEEYVRVAKALQALGSGAA